MLNNFIIKMKRFEILDDIKSDVGFKAYGNTINELFENCAIALFRIAFDNLKLKDEKKCINFSLKSTSIEELLYDFLERLIAESEINTIVFNDFYINVKDNTLNAKCCGYIIENFIMPVKAITNYKFSVKKENDKWVATVYIDV